MRKEGDRGEAVARRVMESAGYVILANNFCVRGGEIDIVARAPDGTTVMVEVKLRAVEPLDHRALMPRKKFLCMRRAAAAWCVKNNACGPRRFDLLLIVRARKIIWYKGIN